jgi:hypothetical protein
MAKIDDKGGDVEHRGVSSTIGTRFGDGTSFP